MMTQARMNVSRRSFLRTLAAGLAAGAWSGSAIAQAPAQSQRLWLKRNQTQESIDAVYRTGSYLHVEGYVAICRLCRDRHVPESEGIRQIDLTVLDSLAAIQRILELEEGRRRAIVIHSGFRTEHTNRTFGGALNSLHQEGRALDFRIEGLDVRTVYEHFLPWHHTGGYGLYVPSAKRANGWIHLDSRPTPRTWRL